ncbi:MAG: hypothetical protein Q9178_007806 [Gyalolechia marmorata]
MNPPLHLASSEADESLNQHCALATAAFFPSGTGATSPVLPQWTNEAVHDDGSFEPAPVVPQNFIEECTRAPANIMPQWQYMMRLEQSDEELRQKLPDAWRKGYEERRRVAATGYSSTGQPRTVRTARARFPSARPSIDPNPGVVDSCPITLQAPLQTPWNSQPFVHGSTFQSPQGIATGSSWWYGEHNGHAPSAPDTRSEAAEAVLWQHY